MKISYFLTKVDELEGALFKKIHDFYIAHPTDPEVSLFFSQVLYNSGGGGFIEILQRSLAINSNHQESWKFLARLYYEKDKFELALNAYEKVLTIDSCDHDSWVEIAELYFDLNKFDEAINAANVFLKLDPSQEGVSTIKALSFLGKYYEITEKSPDRSEEIDLLQNALLAVTHFLSEKITPWFKPEINYVNIQIEIIFLLTLETMHRYIHQSSRS